MLRCHAWPNFCHPNSAPPIKSAVLKISEPAFIEAHEFTMSRPFYSRATKISAALAAVLALQLAGCGSPEVRAQRYYEDGVKLLAAHEDAKAAVEFRNALRLKNDLLPAWRGLAQTEEDTHHLEGLVPVLQAILDLDPKDEATRIKLAKLLVGGGAPNGLSRSSTILPSRTPTTRVCSRSKRSSITSSRITMRPFKMPRPHLSSNLAMLRP